MKPVKWKKCLVFILFVISILFSSSASGHSGRTDGKGGHYDRSTGEYHYHHGYPAHDHYDMDRDGTIDCPYDFDDQTTHKSGKTSSKASSRTSSATVAPDESDTVNWGLAVPILIASTLFVLYPFCRFAKDCIKDAKQQRKYEEKLRIEQEDKERKKPLIQRMVTLLNQCLQDENQRILEEQQRKRRIFEEEKAKCTALYGGRSIYEIIDAPSDSEIGEDGLPKNIGAKGWGTKYTFYTSAKGTRYHTDTCRYTNLSCKENAYVLAHSDYIPCSLCKPVLPDVSWVDEYRKIYKKMVYIKNKYGVDICI